MGRDKRLWTLLILVLVKTETSNAECRMDDKQCEFHFEVKHHLTMMLNRDLVFPDNGKLYKYDVTNTSIVDPIPTEKVITADGWEIPRLVALVNGQFPGPDIVVYEGQTVIVYVKNKMRSHGLTIHWHGLHQTGTPWMDGVPWVIQCPIHPGQTFKYQFKAEPRGTFWWHTHVGAQRSMGVFGAFIVKERQETVIEDLIMQIQDWNHDHESDNGHQKMLTGIYNNRTKWNGAQSLDGSFFSLFHIQSALINGRGRVYDPNTGKSNIAPLTVYEVTKGKTYRFRVICPGSLYPFRVSVDDHVMTVVASDGYDLEPKVVESFVINPGERFDFHITVDQPVGNYWIRGITLEKGSHHKADAILQYDGAPSHEPTTNRRNCRQNSTCIVLNCPFTFYPEEFTYCVTFDELKSLEIDDPAPEYETGRFHEYFLNFGFPGKTTYPSSVNSRSFDTPDVNPLTQSNEWHSPCEAPECGEGRHCKCTHTLEIGKGDTIQMVFTNMGRGRGWSHPIHMHGHSFYVLKMGYGQYNVTNGQIIADNNDINCRGVFRDKKDSFCNDATWSNKTWLNGNVPGLELDRPPRKDTIIVPTGGYVVVRIRVNNPGLWNMHCHIELHNLDGMQMLINESFSEVPAPPIGFPKCRSYPPSFDIDDTESSMDEMLENAENGVTFEQYAILLGLIIAVVVIQLLIGIGLYFGLKKKSRSSTVKPRLVEVGQHNPGFDDGH